MKITPDLEAYFIAITLQHGIHPKPTWGIDRMVLARKISDFMRKHPGEPESLKEVRRNYAELGGLLSGADPFWFYSKLAEAYLDWLYSQEESRALLQEAIQEIHTERKRRDILEQPAQWSKLKW